MRELQFISSGQLEWREKEAPSLQGPRDALVRPFVASRCDGDVLPIHRPVSRAMQVGLRTGMIDPVVGSILGSVPFQGPFGIGHECIAQVVAGVSSVRPILPDLLDFVAGTEFPAEKVTTLLADWEDAPTAYATRTKLVLHRPPIDQ